MAGRLNVNPNRMELLKLRRRLAVARRGYKLLRDKFEELMKRFMEVIQESVDLREQVEAELAEAYRYFALARSEVSTAELDEALAYPSAYADVTATPVSMVSITVPSFDLETGGDFDCYGLALTPALFDEALERFSRVLPKMVMLAEKERTVTMLAAEIERTRRRVNALEFVLIPQLEETVGFITMKLDEFERANLARLMKIKDMVSESD